MKIYKAHYKRLYLLMINEISTNICWLIEENIQQPGEVSNPFVSYVSGFGKNIFVKKRTAKWFCFKCPNCVRLAFNKPRCKTLRMVSVNREDKIKFVKDGMSKELLDDILRSFETYPSRSVQREIHNL